MEEHNRGKNQLRDDKLFFLEKFQYIFARHSSFRKSVIKLPTTICLHNRRIPKQILPTLCPLFLMYLSLRLLILKYFDRLNN